MAINHLERRGFRPVLGMQIGGALITGRRARQAWPCSKDECSVRVDIDEDEVYVEIRVDIERFHRDCSTLPSDTTISGTSAKRKIFSRAARKNWICNKEGCGRRIQRRDRYTVVQTETIRFHMACALRHQAIEKAPEVTPKIGRRAAIAMTAAKRAAREQNVS